MRTTDDGVGVSVADEVGTALTPPSDHEVDRRHNSALAPAQVWQSGARRDMLGSVKFDDSDQADVSEVEDRRGARFPGGRVGRTRLTGAAHGDAPTADVAWLLGQIELVFPGTEASFTGRALAACVSPPVYGRLIGQQMMRIGFYSLPVVGLTAFFTGGALALQIYLGGNRYGAEAIVPQIVVLVIFTTASSGLRIVGFGRSSSALKPGPRYTSAFIEIPQ